MTNHSLLQVKDRLKTKPSRSLSNNPFVSVIILNYNSKRFIRPCLESVLEDSYQPKEILFVDNDSTDHSLDEAYAYQDRITIVANAKNYGFPKGCNQGIRIARGRYIVLLNVDTVVCPGWLESLIRPFLLDSSVGFVGSKLLFPRTGTIQFAGGVMEPNCLTHHLGYGEYDEDGAFQQPQEVDYLTGASAAVAYDLLQKLGGLDEGFPLYYEDLDLSYRIRQAGFQVRYEPASVVYHYETVWIEKTRFAYYYKYHRGRLHFLFKHFGLRYFVQSFLPYETAWLRRCNWRQQILPLAMVYATQLPIAPYRWLQSFVKRRWG